MEKIRVVVTGACGKMGKEVIAGVRRCPDMELVGAVDICNQGIDIGVLYGGMPLGVPVTENLDKLLASLAKPVVLIDFTFKEAARKNIPVALKNGVHVVMGTTGLSQEELAEFGQLAEENNVGLFVAPNFSLGAVLMMKAAREIARYLDQVEIIEYHNEKKVDNPSGTAIATARGIKENTTATGCIDGVKENGARGADYEGIRIHSVRLKSLVAHQEVLFSGCGELLTIRHDSFARESFIPGILMAVRKVSQWSGMKYGLETIME